MLLIERRNQLLLAFDYSTDRYVISRYTGKVIEQSNNRSAIGAAWRRLTGR